jgi:hypothetical protein
MTLDPSALRAKVSAAICEADASFGYSFNLTRLVDGEQTHTLSMPGFDPIDFIDDREEGYRLIEERRAQVRADAILAVLQPHIDALTQERDALRGALGEILALETYALHVGYDECGSYVWADAVRTDDPAFRRAQAALARGDG